MKRYLAFYGDIYYPSGGMEDFIGDFDTLESAISALEENHIKHSLDLSRDEDSEWEWAWGHIWDSKAREVVYKKVTTG